MSQLRRNHEPDARVRAVEMLVLLVVSAIGIYALGRGLSGLSEPGQGVNFLWLAISAAAVWILVTQMGRVQDAWPRRDDSEGATARPIMSEEVEMVAPLATSGNDGDKRP